MTNLEENIVNYKKRNNRYTLVWKNFSGIVNFLSFVTFERLKVYVKKYIHKGLIKNLKSVDKEKTIYYLEIKE